MAGENTNRDERDEPLSRPRWLTINQLREILPLKKSRIYYLTHVAAIPHHKIGQTLLFREDEILEWMVRNRVA
jgi:excisionase family DNA binding protein